MIKTLLLAGAALMLLGPWNCEAGENPFISRKATQKEVRLPTVAAKVLAKIALWQRQLNTKLTALVKRLKTDRSWAALWPLIVVSFLYGVVHAAGPGHGKVVVFSYFISRRSSVGKGILLGNLIGLFHAVSGILIVLALYLIVKTAYLASFEAASETLKLVSYGLVIAIGCILLFRALFPAGKNEAESDGNDPDMAADRKGILALAVAVGLVPCPGVVIIMLFAISFDLPFTGLIMAFLMGLGMAATISLAGLLTILGQEGLLKGLAASETVRNRVQRGLTVGGSLLIIAFGSMLLTASL